MQKKIAIVTGSSRGIGKAIALELARLGYDLLLHYNQNEEAILHVQNEIQSLGRRAEIVQGNITLKADAQRIIDTAFKHWDHVNVLVNNAGITKDRAFVFMEDQDWHDVINTNLTGTYNVTRCVVYKMMRQRYGSIINIGSVAGNMGIMGQVNYCTSKAAINGFTRALAKELANYGICVNCVAPGYITTDMTDKMPQKNLEEANRRIPLGRFGSPHDIAGIVGYLTSDAAKYITGQVYTVDGGMTV
jgi:3-oxoacyl-[acyl-carrier protein] reductase